MKTLTGPPCTICGATTEAKFSSIDTVGWFVCPQELQHPKKNNKTIDKEALKKAAKKLRKLRLTTAIPIMDKAPPCETVKSVLKTGLGGLYSDEVIEYILEAGLRYYKEEEE